MKKASLALALTTLAFSADALAQVAPATGTATAATATTGKTEVTAEGKFAAVEKPADPAAIKDATELKIAAGGLLSSGNARLVAATAALNFRLRRLENQFRTIAAFNYGRSAPADGSGDWATSVENYQALARYDRYVGSITFFGALQARRDRFQGLNVRLQADPGVAYYFVNSPDSQAWAELGYNFMHDVRTAASIDEAFLKDGSVVDKTRTVHSGRVFLGFSTKLSENLAWNLGVEFLQGLSDTKLYRFNTDTMLTAKVAKSFSLGIAFSERYESVPVAGKKNLDTTTTLNLVYQAL